MPKGRVQVNDLAAPDAIRPAPLQSDTFEAVAPPMIDQNMERLASALGHFGARVAASLNDPEAKRALQQKHLAEWETWKAARTDTQQLDAIRAGKAPIYADVFMKAAVGKDYAGLEANKMAADLDADLQAGKVPAFGTVNFDTDAHMVEAAKPYVARLGGDTAATIAFGNNLDHIKKLVKGKHQEALGIAQTQHIDDMARTSIDAAITDGMNKGLDGAALTDGLRPTYKDIGPRLKGGSLDIKHGRADDLVLDVLQRKVQDPRYARQALWMLDAERKGMDGETVVPALSAISRHSDKIAALRSAAQNTMAGGAKRATLEFISKGDVAAVLRRDGSSAKITDFDQPNPADPLNKSITIGEKARQDNAITGAIQTIRAANGGQENFVAEMDVMIKNGFKHPEFIKELEQGFVGGLNANVPGKGLGPDQIALIMKAGERYNQIADNSHVYAETHLSKKAHDFFELYSTLTRFAGHQPEQAAAEVARVYSQDAEEPHVAAGRQAEIKSAAARLDYSWLPASGGVAARGEVEGRIVKLATALAKSDSMDQDTALNAAAARVQSSAVYINGRAVMAPGIVAGDEPHVQTILNNVFEQNKAHFEANGISDATHLSVAARRNGVFDVVRWDGGHVTVPRRDPGTGEVSGISPIQIKSSSIRAEADAAEKTRKIEGNKAFVKENAEAREQSNGTFSPENLIDRPAKAAADWLLDPWREQLGMKKHGK